MYGGYALGYLLLTVRQVKSGEPGQGGQKEKEQCDALWPLPEHEENHQSGRGNTPIRTITHNGEGLAQFNISTLIADTSQVKNDQGHEAQYGNYG